MSQSATAESKISLPKFLKILTDNNVPVKQAMSVAGKIYKDYCTPSKLCDLSDFNLSDAGVEEKDVRKLVILAVRKAGYTPTPKTPRTSTGSTLSNPTSPSVPGTVSVAYSATSSPTMLTSVQILTTPTKRKRKQAPDKNEFLPDGPLDEVAALGNLDFDEVLDEEVLKTKSTTVNRAPLMTAWAMIVAERMGFQREEALSIASVYTEMNALSKGVSIGIFQKGKDEGIEAARDGSQPYVNFIGRR
ncbi:hypothetical protein HGRIS_009521 [Hohenbuehelia grisea]|uniref:Uncharacterized protein n=1 Tax=Hohenbuehelia grisea TaxID=104357 RepID=A0ABR3J1V3_9AGAR